MHTLDAVKIFVNYRKFSSSGKLEALNIWKVLLVKKNKEPEIGRPLICLSSNVLGLIKFD